MKQLAEKVFRGILSLALLVACAVPASAAQKRPKTRAGAAGTDTAAARPASEAACPADDAVGRAGLRAFIDPRTGQLREPTPEEAAQLAAAAHASRLQALSELEVVLHPNGMRSVDLKGAFLIDVVARRNPDGSLTIDCLPPGAAGPPPRGARPPAPVLEER